MTTSQKIFAGLLLLLQGLIMDINAQATIDDKETTTVTSVLQRLQAVEQQGARQAQQLEVLTLQNAQQADVIQHQQQELDALRQRYGNDTSSLRQRTRPAAPSAVAEKPETRSTFTAYACTSSTITATCPAGRTILMTSGTYGQYDDLCSDSCCPPNPQFDCTELIEENRPSDWLAIQALCDGQESCQVLNQGSAIDECEVGYQSDYMQLFYDCLPDNETGPVSSIAFANTGGQTSYNSGDIIVFENVQLNLGGQYNADTSSFLCPADGLYVISVHARGYLSTRMSVNIMQNGLDIAEMTMDEVSDAYISDGMSLVTQCSRGDVIWVKAGSTGLIYGLGRTTFFSVTLMQRL